MANNAHQPGGKVQALGSFSGETMSKLAEVWYDRSGAVESGSVLLWRQVKGQIAIHRILCPKVAEGFEIQQTALTLVKSDRRAQRAVYDVSKLAVLGSKGFGPQVTELDWYGLVPKMAEVPTVKEVRSMGGVGLTSVARAEGLFARSGG